MLRRPGKDPAEAVRSAVDGEESTAPAERLSVLEEEHRLLSDRRRRLHQSIDLLEGFANVKPDAALRLQRYKLTEREVSRIRAELYREIGELRLEQRAHQYQS